MVSDVTQRISASANEIFGELSNSNAPNTRTKRTPWWNKKCYEAVQNRRKAQHAAERHPTYSNLLNLRRLTAIARNVCKNEKKQSLQDYISSLKYDTPQSQVWNKIRNFKSVYRQPNYPIVENSKPILTSIGKGNAFACHFQNASADLSVTNAFHNSINQGIKKKGNNLGQSITMNEVESVIESLKNTSPGLDFIPNQLIKKLNSNYLSDILTIFNQSIYTGIVPSNWKVGQVVPILKPGKSPEKCESYRPISLLSCLGKLLEKILVKRLEHYLENNNKLSKLSIWISTF